MLASRIHQFFVWNQKILSTQLNPPTLNRKVLFKNTPDMIWFSSTISPSDFNDSIDSWPTHSRIFKPVVLVEVTKIILRKYLIKPHFHQSFTSLSLVLIQLLVSRSQILNHFKFGELAWKKKTIKTDWLIWFLRSFLEFFFLLEYIEETSLMRPS